MSFKGKKSLAGCHLPAFFLPFYLFKYFSTSTRIFWNSAERTGRRYSSGAPVNSWSIMWDYGENFVSLHPELRRPVRRFRRRWIESYFQKHPSPRLFFEGAKSSQNPCLAIYYDHMTSSRLLLWPLPGFYYDQLLSSRMAGLRNKVKGKIESKFFLSPDISFRA